MAGSFLLFFREGIEAMLIVSVLLVYLDHAGRRDQARHVYAGAGVAVVLAAVTGGMLFATVREGFVGSTAQSWLETAIFAVAACLLTYMTFWMRLRGRELVRRLRSSAGASPTTGSAVPLFSLAFVTVGREALEASILLVAFSLKNPAPATAAAAVAGLVVSAAASILIYRMGRRVNVGRLLNVVGSALLVVAAGLAANAVHNLQQLGALPGASGSVFDLSRFLPDSSTLGDVLHGLLGYTAAPTQLQFLAWSVFIVLATALFWVLPGRMATARGAAA